MLVYRRQRIFVSMADMTTIRWALCSWFAGEHRAHLPILSSLLSYVFSGHWQIQRNCCFAYSCLNVQVNVSALLLDTCRKCDARYTSQLQPNTVLIRFALCRLLFSSYRGETRSFVYASMGVVNSRYDWNNRHHEQFDPRISLRIIDVVVVV